MIEQIKMLPMTEKISLFLAINLWLIAYLLYVLRQPAVDSKSRARAIRQLRLSYAIGLASLASAISFGILHFSTN